MRQLKLLAAILLASCSLALHAQDVPTKDTATDAKATIVFYRVREAYGAVLKPSVFCNGAEIGRMRNGRFMSKEYAAGQCTITSTLPGSGAVIDMKPGQTYYIRVKISQAGLWHGGRGEVLLVDPGQGKFESSQTKPAEPEDLKPEDPQKTKSSTAS